MSSRANFIGIAPQLVVKDVVQTAEYYRDILGFTILGYFLTPPVYAMVERDGCQIHFGKSDAGEVKPNHQLRSISTDFIIWVPEIDAFYEEIKSKGAEITEHITLRVYGSREFIVRDCNGFLITFGD